LTEGTSTAWTPRAVKDLTATDFIRVISAQPNHEFYSAERPDFSAGGGPIGFGVFRLGGSSTDTFSMGLDNWSVTVHPVLQQAVHVQAADGRGGLDTQDFTIGFARPAQIQGSAFNDQSGNGIWDRRSDLVVLASSVRHFDAATGVLINQTALPRH